MPMNLSFRQLLTFRTVMEAGSISEAARRLGRTQPAVSSTIASLEDELGFELFERRKRRLSPRPEALYFLEEVGDVLERLHRSSRTMREIGDLKRGVLRIACMPAAAAFMGPTLLASFLADKPDVTASLMSRSSAVVVDWIASQQYDIGIAETPPARSSILIRTFETACVCALRADHPLATRDVVTPADLDGEPMAALYPAHHTSQSVRSAFEGAGAEFRQRFEAQTFLSALEFVRQGQSCSVCDPITARSYALHTTGGAEIAFRRFEPAIPYPVSILTPAHQPTSSLAAAFADRVAEDLKKLACESIVEGA